MSLNRPEMYRFHNGGAKDTLPFADHEYHDRLAGLRDIMEMHELDAIWNRELAKMQQLVTREGEKIYGNSIINLCPHLRHASSLSDAARS